MKPPGGGSTDRRAADEAKWVEHRAKLHANIQNYGELMVTQQKLGRQDGDIIEHIGVLKYAISSMKDYDHQLKAIRAKIETATKKKKKLVQQVADLQEELASEETTLTQLRECERQLVEILVHKLDPQRSGGPFPRG